MNYSYVITRVSRVHRHMSVTYSSEGQEDITRNFSPSDYSQEGLMALIETSASSVVAAWEYQNSVEEVDEQALVGIDVPASYWPEDEELPTEPTMAEQIGLRVTELAEQRWQKEGKGILWIDDQDVTYVFDSFVDSQNRFTAAQAAINKGLRQDGGVWKCAKVVNSVGDFELVFRPMSNAELSTVADLVHNHVQKCFEAESIAIEKLMAGDLDVNYSTEFDAL